MSHRAAVVYRSRTGVTQRYGEAIAAYLRERGVDAAAMSIADCDPASLASFDLVLLGCWTNGWFVVHQHPDTPWVAFARDLPALPSKTVALFTTYRLVTGTMFVRMRAELAPTGAHIAAELKSRNGRLADGDRRAIDGLIERLAAG